MGRACTAAVILLIQRQHLQGAVLVWTPSSGCWEEQQSVQGLVGSVVHRPPPVAVSCVGLGEVFEHGFDGVSDQHHFRPGLDLD